MLPRWSNGLYWMHCRSADVQGRERKCTVKTDWTNLFSICLFFILCSNSIVIGPFQYFSNGVWKNCQSVPNMTWVANSSEICGDELPLRWTKEKLSADCNKSALTCGGPFWKVYEILTCIYVQYNTVLSVTESPITRPVSVPLRCLDSRRRWKF